MDKSRQTVGFFLVHSIDCGIGGMESHQKAFIDYFFNEDCDSIVKFKYIIENNKNIYTIYKCYNKRVMPICQLNDIKELSLFINEKSNKKPLLFLNDGWWIECILEFRVLLSNCLIIMRSGGNDIELAPWNRGSFSYSQRRMLWKHSINKLNYIIANSDYSVSLLKKLSVLPIKIIKIRGGVNEYLSEIFREKKDIIKTELREKLKIEQKYILLFACRFVPFKGIMPALRIFLKSHAYNECHLIFVGSGILKIDIENWCIENLNNNQFTFMGELSNDETLKIIAASDILINTSMNYLKQSGDGFYIHTETMGRSMMEAISVRTKIFATNVGGTNELFKENVGIGYLASYNEQSIIYGFNNIENILSEQFNNAIDYSWKSVFFKYNNVFNSLIQ